MIIKRPSFNQINNDDGNRDRDNPSIIGRGIPMEGVSEYGNDDGKSGEA